MEQVIEYLLKVSAVWAAILLWYRLFLRKQSLLEFNRIILLGGLLLPPILFCLPAWRLIEEKVYVHNLAGIAVKTGAETIAKPLEAAWPFWAALLLGGMVIGTLRLGWSLFQLRQLFSRARKEKLGNTPLLRIPEVAEAYTFFGYIVVGEKIAAEDLPCVVEHEAAHRRLGHSFDTILVELCSIAFWFHPLIYLFKSLLTELHEFQADREVRRHYSLQYYGQLLLQHAMNTRVSLFHRFSNHSSQLKKRIFMMSQKNQKRANTWAYLSAMPLMLAFFWMLNVQTISAQTTTEPDEMPTYGDCKGNKDEVQTCSMQNLMKELVEQIKYPKAAMEAKKEGKVFIEFTVAKNGHVKDAKVLKSMENADCDAEALRVVKALKHWKPGKKDGKNVDVKMVLPIAFRLS